MRLRSRTTGALALLILLLICLLATAPARLLGLVLPVDRIVMQGFTGTLWSGDASRCLVKVGPGYLHLGAVRWQLRPLSLLLLAPRLNLESNWGSQAVTAEIVLRGERDLDLSNVSANVSADLLRQFVPVSLAGMLSLQLEELRLQDGVPVQASGRLVWQQGTWLAPSGPVALGSYAMEFSQAPGQELVAEVLTLSGPVNAEGGLRLQGSSYSVELLVEGEGALDERLRQALSLVARPVGSGYRLKLEGELQDPPG